MCHAPYQIKDVYTKISLEGERAVIVGNILNTKGFSYLASKGETVSNNVVFGTNNSFDAENNIIVNASDFDGFVEGKVSGSGFSFNPADNGGCTKTVKLLSSYITDDKTYVRYPKSVYYISEDQRGEKRMDFLCPGSYEIPYEVVEYAGSICRGEKYEDNGFEIDSRDSLGGDYDYYWYEEAKVNKLHTLHLNITPKSCSIDVTAKEFYVKQKGTGNGSSWKNAMSPEDFAGMIPYAVEGATFHIAAGEYDFYKLTNGIYVEKERYGYNYYGRYTWQNKINLIGGYPADAEDIATSSDPENNPTIFTNSYFCEKNHANSYLDVKLGNVHNITFSNFTLQNPTLVDSCTFKSDFACLNLKPGSLASHNAISYSSKNGTANIKNSSFSGDYQNTISCGYVDELVIEGCTFESITTTDIVSGTSGVVKAYNNSFVNNDCYYTFDRNSKEYLVNNTFINASYVSEEYTVFTGNILVDTELEESEEATITNNLVSGTFGIKGTSDKVVEKSDLATILDGTYDKTTGKFTPNLKDNGGYTKTVAIVGDVLPDGKTSIRFKQSTLTTDQRGEKRLDPTCPGAYEYLDGVEKLEFVGKPLVEDNSCSTPNSKVTIKVSGWTQDCFAKTTLANRFDNEEKPVSVKDGVAVFEFNNLGGAKYVFTATNNINSTITYPFEIRTIEAPTITFLSYSSSSSVSCKGSTDANADLVLKGGNEKNYTFTVDNKQNKFFINNKTTVSDLGEGTHVFVYSSNVAGCDDKDEYIYDVKVYDKLEVEGIGLDINCASSKGQAEIKITDGFKTYDVTLTDKAGNEIKKNTSENEFVIEGLTPGVEYTLKVVDKYECESTFEKPIVSKMLAAKPSIVRTAEILALKCAGDKNGSATYTVSGGNSNYGLRVNGGGWLTAQKDGSYLIGNLTAGTYKVEYASKTGDCADVAKDEFTVSEPQALVVDAEASTIRCANEDATVTVSTMGGTKPYSIVLTPKDGENVTVSSSNAITEISGLTVGVSYTVAVTDKNGCKVTYDNDVEIIDLSNPTPTLKTDFTPYSCSGETDGSLTFNIANWYNGYKAYVNGVDVTGDDEFVVNAEKHTATYTKSGLGEANVVKFSATDNCKGGIEEKTYNIHDLAVENGLFELVSVKLGDNPECVAQDREPVITAKGGVSPYKFEIFTTGNSRVQDILSASPISYMETLDDGEYYVVVTEGNGCAVKSKPFSLASSHHVNGTISRLCGRDYTHFELDYEGKAKKIELGDARGFYDHTKDFDADGKIALSKGYFEKARVTFNVDGNDCVVLAKLEEKADFPSLKNLQLNDPSIVLQSCANVDDVSLTVSLKEQEFNFKGYSLQLKIEEATTEKEYTSNAIASLTDKFEFAELAPGNYTPTLQLVAGTCIVSENKLSNDIKIDAVPEPTLYDKDKNPVNILCKGNTAKYSFYVSNWNSDCMEWVLTNPDQSTKKGTEAEIINDNISAIAFNGLTSGLYNFKVVGKNEKTYVNENFVIFDSSKPDITYKSEFSPYTCGGKADGSLTFNISYWYSDYGAFVNGKDISKEKDFIVNEDNHTATYTISGLGEDDVITFQTSNNCSRSDIESFNIKELTQEKGLLELVSAKLGKSPNCVAADRAVVITINGGAQPYTYEIQTAEGENVQKIEDEELSHTMKELEKDGDYVAVVTDAKNCVVKSDPFSLTSSHEISGTIVSICEGTASHVKLKFEGEAVKVELRNAKGEYADVTKNFDADSKTVNATGSFDAVRVTFDGGEGDDCITFGLLEETNELPALKDLKLEEPAIQAQSCFGVEDASLSISLKEQKFDLEGFGLKLKLNDATAKKEYTSDEKSAPSGKFEFSAVAPGNYTATLQLMSSSCVVAEYNLPSNIEIEAVSEPTQEKITANTTDISCKGKYGTYVCKLNNWKEGCMDWTLTKPDKTTETGSEATSVKDGVATFEFKELVAGKYNFTITGKGNKSLVNEDFEILEVTNSALEFTDDFSPYSCNGKTDGSLTFNITNWYNGYKAYVNGKDVTGEEGFVVDGEKHTATYTKSGLGEADVVKFSAEDLCEGGLEETVYNVKELSEKTGLFRLVSAELGKNPSCKELDRIPNIEVAGGKGEYTCQILTSDEKEFDVQTSEETKFAMGKVLSDGDYVAVVTDANGCTDKSDKFSVSTKNAVKGTHAILCKRMTLVHLEYEGTATKVELCDDKGAYVDVTKDYDAEKKSVGYDGVYDKAKVTFEGNCETSVILGKESLSVGAVNYTADPEIVDQSCFEVNNGSYTVHIKTEKVNPDFTLSLRLSHLDRHVYFDTEEELQPGKDCYEGTITVPELNCGSYSPEYMLKYKGCYVHDSKFIREGVDVGEAKKPTVLSDEVKTTLNRCADGNGSMVVPVTNWRTDCSWVLTKDKEEVDVKEHSSEELKDNTNIITIDGLTGGDYVLKVTDACNRPFYSETITISEDVKKQHEIIPAHHGISCENRSDALWEVTVKNWEAEDVATLTNTTTNEEATPLMSEAEEGVKFTLSGLTGDAYKFVTKDVCGTETEDIVDLDAESAKSKMDLKLDYNSAAAVCDAKELKFSATVSGKSAPFTYTVNKLVKKDGSEETAIENMVPVTNFGEDLTYKSGQLDYGTYQIVVNSSDDCEITKEIVLEGQQTLSGEYFACDNNTHIELKYSSEIVPDVQVLLKDWVSVKFEEGANKLEFDYPAEVRQVRVGSTVDGKECYTETALTEKQVTDNLEGVEWNALPVDQFCYNKDNGAINITYSGYAGKAKVVATATNVANEKDVHTSEPGEKENTLVINKLYPGTYNVQLVLKVGECEVASLEAREVTVAGLPEVKDLTEKDNVKPNRCESRRNGSALFKMEGWKDGIYTWHFVKEGDKDGASGTNIDAASTETVAIFNMTGKGAGTYTFSVSDQCSTVVSNTVVIEDKVKPDLELEPNHHGITCEGSKDAVWSITVKNWEDGDKATLNKEAIEPTSVKDGTALFEKSEIETGNYHFVTSDLCGNSDEDKFDLDAENEKTKLQFASLVADVEKAKCDENLRKIAATVSQFSSMPSYKFSVVDADDKEVDGQDFSAATSFESKILDYGTYKVVVSDAYGCEITSKPIEFSATAKLSGEYVMCGNNTHIELNYGAANVPDVQVKLDKWTSVEFAEGADKLVFDYPSVVREVRVGATIDDKECYTVATLTEKAIDANENLLKDVVIVPTATHQKCYGINNGAIDITYSGYDGKMQVVAVVTDVNNAKNIHRSELAADGKTLTVSGLSPGNYTIRLVLTIEGCDLANDYVDYEKAVEIKGLQEPKIAHVDVTPNPCEGKNEGRMYIQMSGWEDGRYLWTMKYANNETEGSKNDFHGKQIGDEAERGLVPFDMYNLPEGENIFSVYNVCDEKKPILQVIETIKGEYINPVTITLADEKPITCENREDGEFTFVVSPWNKYNKATFNDEEAKDIKVEEGKAYFVYTGKGAGKYTLATTDVCSREESKEFDLTAYSEENGLFKISQVDFDADGAKCDVDKRKISINVKGGTAPYIYSIKTNDGSAFETSEAIEALSFTSKKLTDGQFKVEVTDALNCVSSTDDVYTIDPAHTMVAKMQEFACGNKKTVSISASIDEGKTIAESYVAYDKSGKAYHPSVEYTDDCVSEYYELDEGTVLAGISANIGGGCSVYAELGEFPVDEEALKAGQVTVEKLTHQRCYNVNNAEIELKYVGPKSLYDVILRLSREKHPNIDTKPQFGTELNFKFDKLAPGKYELYLVYSKGECDAGLQPIKIKDIEINAIPRKFELVKEYTKVHPSTCYSQMNARSVVAVKGWAPDTYTLTFYDYTESGDLHYRWDGKGGNHLLGEADDVVAWSSGPNLTAGKYLVTWEDICENKIEYEFNVEPLQKPKIRTLESSYTDLLCSYDKAHIDFYYEGGVPENKRILIKYFDENKEEDWDWTTEPLKAENKYRLYGFTKGDGNLGHEKTEDLSYELTDTDLGLPEGKYVVYYEDTSEQCPKDTSYFNVEVKRPKPIRTGLYSEGVLCYDKLTGTLGLVFSREGKTGPKYVSESETTSTNRADLLLLPAAEQEAAYREINTSNMFSDIKQIELVSRDQTHEELYEILKRNIGENRMSYPLDKLCKGGGSSRTVPADWIGFDSLKSDEYYFIITDVHNCQYNSNKVLVDLPNHQKPLTIDEFKFDSDAAYCDANERRFSAKVSGGWGNYVYTFLDVDKIPAEGEEYEFDTNGGHGTMLDPNYVQDGSVEAFGEEKTASYYEKYVSPVLQPGHLKFIVYDDKGCMAESEVYTVKEKYTLSGDKLSDWCDPTKKNLLFPTIKEGAVDKTNSASSYTLRIGHNTEEKGKVEMVDVALDDLVLEKDNAGFIGRKYIGDIPKGRVGLFAYMNDGCSAFKEFDFEIDKNFLPLTLLAEEMTPAPCYGEPGGSQSFTVYGGNNQYTNLYLDGHDLMSSPGVVELYKNSHATTINGDDWDVKDDTVQITFADFTNEDLFKQLNPVSSLSPNGSSASKTTSYTFTLSKLVGNTNRYEEDVNIQTSHQLTVQDLKGCQSTLNFVVDQPEKLVVKAAGSVMCPDGAGRIFAESVSGGVAPYTYALDDDDEFTEEDHHAITFGSTGHTLTMKDARGCISEPSNTVETGQEITWDDVIPDVMISTWHNYGDVLVVVDKTNFGVLTYKDIDKTPFDYTYDSMKVEILYTDADGFPSSLVGELQPKEYYTYGIKDGEEIEVPWMDKTFEGPSWGIPSEVLLTIRPDAQLDFMNTQYGIEVGELDALVHDCINRDFNNKYAEYRSEYFSLNSYIEKNKETLIKQGTLAKKQNELQSKKSKWEIIYKQYETEAKKKVKYDEKVAALYDKYGMGYAPLSRISQTFHKLVPDESAKRMEFIKFEDRSGKDHVLDKYINSKNESEVLNFGIKTTTYVSGCDITTEYNPLVLNLKGNDPYPTVQMKNYILVECNPSIIEKGGSTTLEVYMDQPEDFVYQIFSVGGKSISDEKSWKKEEPKVVTYPSSENKDGLETPSSESPVTKYLYTIDLEGVNENSVIRVVTPTTGGAAKLMVK